jgi:hypothetical protein
MTTILVRCSVHAELSHDAFSAWLERRRGELAGETGELREIEARRLGQDELMIELHCAADPGDDSASGAAVQDFVVDLKLLGMSPTVYVTAPTASPQRADESMCLTTTMASPKRTMS